MRTEISLLLDIRSRSQGDPGALRLVEACLEFCFRALVANDDPAQTLTSGEVDRFLAVMAGVRPPPAG